MINALGTSGFSHFTLDLNKIYKKQQPNKYIKEQKGQAYKKPNNRESEKKIEFFSRISKFSIFNSDMPSSTGNLKNK